jgi:hypothetical protein
MCGSLGVRGSSVPACWGSWGLAVGVACSLLGTSRVVRAEARGTGTLLGVGVGGAGGF